jgi:ABC-2 type transport system permease protein
VRELRGLTYLSWLTFRRQLIARKSLIAIILIGLICLATIVWTQKALPRIPADAPPEDGPISKFSEIIVMPIYLGFILPILCLIYATAALGEERDERTLVYLLIRPLARYRIYLAKGLGILPLVMAAGIGGFWLICKCAGETGATSWDLFYPAVVRGSITYACLFLLFGALVPRPLVVSIAYAFFCEALVSMMPGTIKRMAVSFHTKCMIFDAGEPYGVSPDSQLQFLPISGSAAAWVMTIGSLALLAVGAFFFHRKEYRDLT